MKLSDYCLVVTSGAHARFFTLEPAEHPEVESGPRLIERGELFNPEKERRGGDLFSDPKPGRSRGPRRGLSHGYNDHRVQHENEMDRRFAHRVMEKTILLAQAHQVRCLVMVAPPRMLQLFRRDLHILRKHGVELHKVAKDISRLSLKQIHYFLAKEEILPLCKKPEI